MTLSIIIPAFNAASFIADCLASVVRPGVEVIVVDDGSTDGTGDIVETDFPAVRVIRQPNQGVSAARNAGIRSATGDFLAFVDADDRLSPDAVWDGPGLADIVIMRSFGADAERYPWKDLFQDGQTCTAGEIGEKAYVRGSVCGCLFNRKYLVDNGLYFNESLSIAEDTVFFANALSARGTVRFRDVRFYEISERPGSVTRSLNGDYLRRYGLAVTAAARDIADPVLRVHTCFSLIQGIIMVGTRMGLSSKAIRTEAGFSAVLPLPTAGIRKDRWKIALLNGCYPLFCFLKRLKSRLS